MYTFFGSLPFHTEQSPVLSFCATDENRASIKFIIHIVHLYHFYGSLSINDIFLAYLFFSGPPGPGENNSIRSTFMIIYINGLLVLIQDYIYRYG
ncbi:hypothetical protein CLOHYLEM_07078 [[Clostridium] hylemonae DSM 15053]|uniref:Uncharacterized protein n=1 Tax=[Clostridium] hylemonae DSM 15053 TaxID=553973 RepID=C0C4R3_9FIRM|nr:hypothetical protein CLOHYLEM_07078 [[Clostridium] hylemonae DSM 15053]